jgi:hypothetical protein
MRAHWQALPSAARAALKGVLLFLALNLLFAVGDPLPPLGRLSIYNHLVPGRVRLPYGEHPARAYNLGVTQLDGLFAAHELSGRPKPADELRVILIGDSSTWGFLLAPEDTLAARLNAQDLRLSDGRRLRFYNLGYPVMSLTKDVLILDWARRFQPDLIVWALTLESFPQDKQLYPPLLQRNPAAVRDLTTRLDLPLDLTALPPEPSGLERTLWGSRRRLADLIRLQVYGLMWAATGVDQDLPDTYTSRQEDLTADLDFHGLQPPRLQPEDLAWGVLEAGIRAAPAPVLLVNEPMFISSGQNHDLRYNFFYPRWAYDDYRRQLQAAAAAQGWPLIDLWDAIPSTEFTNSAFHITPAGSELLAQQLGPLIRGLLARETLAVSR